MNETMVQIIGYLAACGTTISFIPQAVQTIKTKDTKGISLSMYILFNIGVFLWLVYGIFINAYPVIIANAITLVFTMIILFYKIRYK